MQLPLARRASLLLEALPLFAGLVAQRRAQGAGWDAAIVRKDSAAIAVHVRVEFRHLSEEGRLTHGRTFVHNLLDPHLRLDPYSVEDFVVRRYGDVALLSGRTRPTDRYHGCPFQISPVVA